MRAGAPALAAVALLSLVAAEPTRADESVASLKDRIIEIQNRGKLGIRNLCLCRSIATYGQYARNETRRVAKGEVARFYYEPENMTILKERDIYRIWYTQDIVLLGKDGKEILRSDEALTFNHFGLQPILDLYATNELDLGELPPGDYRYRVILHDKLRGGDATAEIAFTITGP